MDVFHKKKKVVTLGSEGGGVPWGGALHQIWLTNCCKLHPDIRPNVQEIMSSNLSGAYFLPIACQ